MMKSGTGSGIFAALLLLTSFCTSCGSDRQVEQYAGITATQFTLTAQNHPHGKGQPNCFSCHVIGNFHQIQTGSGLDVTDIRAKTPTYTLDDCRFCHCGGGSCP